MSAYQLACLQHQLERKPGFYQVSQSSLAIPCHDILGLIGVEVDRLRLTAQSHSNYKLVVCAMDMVVSEVDTYLGGWFGRDYDDDHMFLTNLDVALTDRASERLIHDVWRSRPGSPQPGPGGWGGMRIDVTLISIQEFQRQCDNYQRYRNLINDDIGYIEDDV